ncbi:NAD(P)-dependent dehydrogenase (short-subunit alcohol dehydrogenase family) [Mumia flava]|uniref:NAD(P)-dependent dehydrogenase (Short-subunit alcohol dehydrogenase family) n=2 Tax=Mumia flava TaxID=1348852 RepID=A0A0B2BB22_9ACTN|nr:NAD(P)-dependent dehydrogenase (short-subunit alcohol dehydrogenase family) [Mumia flava]
MTGGTSGFGALAAQDLVRRPRTRVILGSRRAVPYGEPLSLDLTRLDATERFAGTVATVLGDDRIGALLLNAGVIRRDTDARTPDGFEVTFASNHLAHFLLLRRLAPRLADGAVVVITTSGTHDPATRAGLAPPRHADADLLAHPERDPGRDARPRRSGQHAYTASKLCAVLTARRFAADGDVRRRGITVVALCPGQVFGTGLAADLPLPMRAAWQVLGTPWVSRPLRAVRPTFNTAAAAAGALTDLATGHARPPGAASYAALRRGRVTWPEPSVLARDDDVADALWRDSAGLVGLAD